MDDGLANLALLAVMFVGSHFILSHPPVRKFLIHRWNVWPFRIIYSTIAIILFLMMIVAYGDAPDVPLALPALTLAPLVAMPLAAILIFCGYTIANPSAAGTENMGKGQPVPGILKITRQPTMWGVTLFSVAHMAANPDAAAWIFFGALAVLALAGSYFLDRRKQGERDDSWQELMAVSSFVPFAALLSGRARLSVGEIGWWRILGGLVLFGAVLMAHEMVIGSAPLPPELMALIQV